MAELNLPGGVRRYVQPSQPREDTHVFAPIADARERRFFQLLADPVEYFAPHEQAAAAGRQIRPAEYFYVAIPGLDRLVHLDLIVPEVDDRQIRRRFVAVDSAQHIDVVARRYDQQP